MNFEHELLTLGQRRLETLGFEVLETRLGTVHEDAFLRVSRRGRHILDVPVELRETLDLAVAERAAATRPEVLHIVRWLAPKTADALRRRGIWFIDAAGNAYIETADTLIDVRGRSGESRASSLPQKEDIFSPRRAQVLFALISWPSLRDASLREIAEAAGVSVGSAHGAVNGLEHEEYDLALPDSRDRLIEAWVAAYPSRLAKSLTLGTFHAEQVYGISGDGVALSGEAASPMLHATRAVVYVPELTTELILGNRWRSNGPQNVTVRRRFWNAPGDGHGPGTAPPLAVYADLLAEGDSRSREAAAEFRAQLA